MDVAPNCFTQLGDERVWSFPQSLSRAASRLCITLTGSSDGSQVIKMERPALLGRLVFSSSVFSPPAPFQSNPLQRRQNSPLKVRRRKPTLLKTNREAGAVAAPPCRDVTKGQQANFVLPKPPPSTPSPKCNRHPLDIRFVSGTLSCAIVRLDDITAFVPLKS